jgi:hypothetical protein
VSEDTLNLDPLIAPLVRAMNESGLFRTIASCQGHRWQATGPYVYFHSSIAAAAALQRCLNEDLYSNARRLCYYWEASSQFNPAYELCFRLHSPRLDRVGWWRARRLEGDLITLQSMVAEVTQLWQHHKPTIGQGGCREHCRQYISEEYAHPETGGVGSGGVTLTTLVSPETDHFFTRSAWSKRHDFPPLRFLLRGHP